MSDSCGCGNGHSGESCAIELTDQTFGKNPDSYKTGQLIEKFLELGFDVIFHGPTKDFPNGHITLESMSPEDNDFIVIADTVAITYAALNDILEMDLEWVTKYESVHWPVSEGDCNE